MDKQYNAANDYALAKYLNKRVVAIFALVANNRGNLPDLTGINRSYVLLVNEIKKLYARHAELSDIRDNICWRTFGTIDAMEPYTLFEYSDDYTNHAIEHISKVNSLCIIAGKEQPELTPELKKVLDDAERNVAAFRAELDKMHVTLSIEYVSGRPVVSVGDEKYYLSAMRDGLALTIISYCLKHHPDKQIDLKTLKSELSEAEIKAPGLNNLRENIRNSHFGDKKPLSPFVAAYPKTILVRKTAELSDEQIDAIKLAGS